jgi:hypothetical protein
MRRARADGGGVGAGMRGSTEGYLSDAIRGAISMVGDRGRQTCPGSNVDQRVGEWHSWLYKMVVAWTSRLIV